MKRKISYILSILGLVPFIGLSILINHDYISPIDISYEMMLAFYCFVIASFLAGIHWGQAQSNNFKLDSFLVILSNVSAIIIWLSFFFWGYNNIFIVFALIFTFILFIDYCLFRKKIIDRDYFIMRFYLSIIVIFTLVWTGI